MIRYSAVVLLISVVTAALAVSPRQESADQEDSGKKKQDDKIVLSAKDENAVARRDFMRTKMMFSQNIFEGLTTGNFHAIEEAVKEVQSITQGEQWVTVDDERYQQLVEEFQTSTDRLMAAAKTENIEATALRFYEMSTSCIDCHQLIRIADYEF